MPLILAIEPNKSQAQQIALMVKQHLKGAELVAAASAEAALAAVGDRIPDLILTPALLTPRDEGALTERLRQLGAAAAHIHTLAAPIIQASAPRVRQQVGGLLGRRRDKSEAESVGCEPSVFAEQIKEYLDRAAREREIVDADSAPVESAAAAQEAAAPDAPGPGEIPIRIDDFEEIVWLPEQPAPVAEPARVVEPPIPVVESPPPTTELPVVEKRRARSDNAATRAFEAEFGLPPASSTSPPLWRVTEVGIEAMAAEPPPAAIDEPARAAEDPAPIAAAGHAAAATEDAPVVRPQPKAPKPPKAKKAAPPLDDWAYFDPQQSPFRALIKRLDEIAGHTAAQAT